jgi:hypothetical protein
MSLEGTQEELRVLSGAVREGSARLPLASDSNREAYDQQLTAIAIETRIGERVSLGYVGESSTLLITGDGKYLNILAGNIENVADGIVQGHVHIEFFPNHYYLSETTESLVVEKSAK